MQLTVVLTDFHPAGVELGAATLPRLPALEILLQFGRAGTCADDPRRELGRARTRDAPASGATTMTAARLVAHLVREASGVAAVWLATPVHVEAALDHLRMHRAGMLRLDADALGQLAAEFGAEFGDTGLTLVPAGAQLLLCDARGVLGAPADTQDPARFLGSDIGSGLPRGAGGAALRRFGAELEMWLHAHELNRVREARGALPVSTLWLWGGEGSEPFEIADDCLAARVPVHADDAIVAGLCAVAGRGSETLPADFAALAAQPAAHRVVVLSAAPRDVRDAPLLRLERHWLAPAIAALRARTLRSCTLLAGGQRRELALPRLARVLPALSRWRDARPWWENFACTSS